MFVRIYTSSLHPHNKQFKETENCRNSKNDESIKRTAMKLG